MNKPYSESCDQNKKPILSVISSIFSKYSNIFEIGSGTGQHAVYFAKQMPYLRWHTSDRKSFLDGISMWLRDARLDNVVAPVELDVINTPWPETRFDAVFSANTLHIMNDHAVIKFMTGVGHLVRKDGSLVIYGPFNYADEYTSSSNASFDQWLQARDPDSGIKNFENISALALQNGLKLVKDYEMPANNRILHFTKV